MAFDAGELVATLRGNITPLVRDLAKARSELDSTASTANTTGKTVEAAGTRAATGTRQAAAAARENTTAQQAASTAARDGAAAATSAAAAQGRAAAATRQAAQASTEAGTAAEAAAASQAAAGEAGRQAGQSAAEGAKQAEDRIEKAAGATEKLGAGLTAYGAVAVASFALAVSASTEFGAKMAQLKTLSGGTEQQMQAEAEAALSLGTAYGLTAGQVADAEIELQKAGQGVADQLNGGLKGALVGAAAGQMDVAEATSIGVTALTQFRLGAGDTEHVFDLLAAGSDKALGSMGDLGAALNQGGLVAAQMGLSIEDTTGTLAAFAQAGLVGSDAGTSLKTMLLSLQSPSTQAQRLLDKYNITAYDSQGAFVGITNLAGQLQSKLGGLSQAQRDAALSTIFGTDAIRSANVLYGQGSAGLQQWITDVNDSGFAAEQAAGKQDSLKGALAKLSSAINTDLIKAGQAVEPALRPAVDVLTRVADVAGAIPGPLLAAATGVAGVTGAVSLGAGALLLFAPRIIATTAALRLMRQEAALATYGTGKLAAGARVGAAAVGGLRTAGGGLASFLGGPWGIALAVGAAAVIAWQKTIDDAKASTDVLDAAAKSSVSGIDQLVAASAKGQNEKRGVFAFLETLGNGDVETGALDGLTAKLQQIAAIKANPFGGYVTTELGATKDVLDTVGQSLARLASSDGPRAAAQFQLLAQKTDGTKASLRTLLGTMPAYEDALRAAAIAQGINVEKGSEAEQQNRLLAFALREAGKDGITAGKGADAAADGIDGVGQSAEDAQKQVDDLVSSIKGLDGGQLDAREASRRFQEAIDDATAAVKDNGKTLDTSTEKGRANQDALDGIASAGLDAAAAYVAAGGSSDGAKRKIAAARADFIRAAQAMGDSKKEAKALADRLNLIPGHVPVVVSVNASGVAAAQAQLDSLHTPTLTRTGRFAQGGRIPGVDTGQDTHVTNVYRPGEHVLTVDDVSAMGGHAGVYNFRRELHGYAAGGAIGDSSSKAGRAATEAEKLRALIERQKGAAKDANAAARRAEKAYEAAQDDSANVYGKGSSGKKHAAALSAREAKKRLDDAKKAAKAAEDKVEDLRARRSKQLEIAKSESDRNLSLSEARDDLAVANSRGQYVDAANPTGAVDFLISQSRNQDLSKQDRAKLATLAKTTNASLVALGTRAEGAGKAVEASSTALDAATSAYDAFAESIRTSRTPLEQAADALDAAKAGAENARSALQSVRSSFDSLVSSVAANVRTVFDLGKAATDTAPTSLEHNAGTGAAWTEMVAAPNSGGATVASIRAVVDQAGASISTFADQLQQLTARGFDSSVVNDVQSKGVTDGSQLAAALLTATDQERDVLNAGYAKIADASTRAGQTVADATMGAEVARAEQASAQADAQLAAAQTALGVAQQNHLAELAAARDLAQAQYNADAANRDSINAQIEAAQQGIVDAISNALDGTGTAIGDGKMTLQQTIEAQAVALQEASRALGKTTKRAYGGIREAQIQPAGRNILWAEKDTGGEAYIPFAPDRRGRALAILDQTARRLGRTVVPAGATTFAMGGILEGTNSSTSYGGDVHNWNGPIFGSPDEILDAADRRARLKRARANRSSGIGGVQP